MVLFHRLAVQFVKCVYNIELQRPKRKALREYFVDEDEELEGVTILIFLGRSVQILI